MHVIPGDGPITVDVESTDHTASQDDSPVEGPGPVRLEGGQEGLTLGRTHVSTPVGISESRQPDSRGAKQVESLRPGGQEEGQAAE